MADETEPKSLWKKIGERHAQMVAIRLPYERVWRPVIELLRPDLSAWDTTEDSDAGGMRNTTVWNSAPQEALDNWADGLQGQTANSGPPDWWYYSMPEDELNDIPEVRKWLEHARKVVAAKMRDSNYYSSLNPFFRDAGSIGNAAHWIERSKDGNGIACSTFHPRESYIGQDSQGNVNQFCRKFKMTAMNAVEKFGLDKLSKMVKDTYIKTPLEKSEFIHLVLPKDDPIFKGESDMPDRAFISVYIDCQAVIEEQHPVKIGGYWSEPFSYWRLQTISDSVYGWGLGCSALVDIYGLNDATRTMMKAANMAVDPAMWIDDSMKGNVHIGPGGRTYGDRNQFKPEVLAEGGKYPYGVDREDRLTAQIDRRFDTDFFLMMARSETVKTATEAMAIVAERATLLSPKIGRLERDGLTRHNERIFGICMEEGWIDPPPDILLDPEYTTGRFDIEYNGQLARAAKFQREHMRVERTHAVLGPWFELFPEARDHVKSDVTTPRLLRELELPEEEIASEDEVAQKRQIRAQQEQAMLQLEIAKEVPGAVQKLQKKTEEGSPLAAVAGAEA